MIKQELDRIKDRISDPSFLANKGLSNEVGIHVFCYDPKYEIVVQDYIRRLMNEANTPYRIIECSCLEWKETQRHCWSYKNIIPFCCKQLQSYIVAFS